MTTSKNKEVGKFLDHLLQTDEEKYKLLDSLRETILRTHTNSEEKIMYGGIIFFFQNEMFSGIFAYKNHVTIEFSKGFLMNDPNGVLEGKGKYRRHLKIKLQKDINEKEVVRFIEDAL